MQNIMLTAAACSSIECWCALAPSLRPGVSNAPTIINTQIKLRRLPEHHRGQHRNVSPFCSVDQGSRPGGGTYLLLAVGAYIM